MMPLFYNNKMKQVVFMALLGLADATSLEKLSLANPFAAAIHPDRANAWTDEQMEDTHTDEYEAETDKQLKLKREDNY